MEDATSVDIIYTAKICRHKTLFISPLINQDTRYWDFIQILGCCVTVRFLSFNWPITRLRAEGDEHFSCVMLDAFLRPLMEMNFICFWFLSLRAETERKDKIVWQFRNPRISNQAFISRNKLIINEIQVLIGISFEISLTASKGITI